MLGFADSKDPTLMSGEHDSTSTSQTDRWTTLTCHGNTMFGVALPGKKRHSASMENVCVSV